MAHGPLGHNQMLCQLSYIRHMQLWSLYQSHINVKPFRNIFPISASRGHPGKPEDAP